jgi:hypothetical protein
MENNVSATREQQEQPVVCLIHKMTFSEGRAYRYHVSDRDGKLLYVAEPTGLLLPSPRRLIEFFDPDRQPAARLEPPETAPWLRVTHYDLFVGGAEEPQAVIREQWRLVDILLLRLPRYTVQLGEHRYVAMGSRYGEHFYEIFLAPEEPQEKAAQIESPSHLMDEDIETGQVYSPPATPGEEIEGTEGAITLEEELPEDIEWPEEDKGPDEADALQMKVGFIERPVAGPSYVIISDVAPLCQAVLVLAALAILIDMEAYG